MMRILLTVDPEIPVPPVGYGGIERIVDWLARGLVKRGHSVALLSHRDSRCVVTENFKWKINSSRMFPDGLQAVGELRHVSQKYHPEIIHSFSRILYLIGSYFQPVPCVMSYQRKPTLKTVRMAVSLFGNSIHFTGCSDHISEIGRAAGGRWTSIYNGVELEKFPFSPVVSSDAPLVFLSRVESIKGAELAVEIAKKSGRRLIIAGNHAENGSEGEYWNTRVKPQIGCHGIEYIGAVNDEQKSELLATAFAMLVPIQWDEPFGIVFAESLACGTPVISCPRGALPEIVEHGLHGFLINNVEEGVNAVANINNIDRKNCRKRVEEKFSSEVIISQYEKLYSEILKERHL